MNNKGKKVLTIIAGSTVTFFSLCSCVIAAIAWFSFAHQAQAEGETFKVITSGDGGAEIKAVNLYKFNYAPIVVGSKQTYDYLKPQNGELCKYLYDNGQSGNGAITGFSKKYESIVDGEWTFSTVNPAVSIMNSFDPVYITINGQQSLIQLNCNAVYEVELSSSYNGSRYMQLDAIKKDPRIVGDLYLTDCLDFDVYTEEDLDDSNFTSGEYNPYYYNLLDRPLTDFEKIYYKVSYLSSLETSHKNFYSYSQKPEKVFVGENEQVSFDNSGNLKVYINVNYSYNQLKGYSDRLYLGDITAIYDFAFSFVFENNPVISEIEINQTEIELNVGNTASLVATTSPQSAPQLPVSWFSNDNSVATVSGGVVTAVGEGTAVISASCNGRTAMCTVTVTGGEGE